MCVQVTTWLQLESKSDSGSGRRAYSLSSWGCFDWDFGVITDLSLDERVNFEDKSRHDLHVLSMAMDIDILHVKD